MLSIESGDDGEVAQLVPDEAAILDDDDQPDDSFEPEHGEPGGRGKHRPAPGAARGRRTSVPSWDDIMFGAKRD